MAGFIDTFNDELVKLAKEKERSYGEAVGQAYLRLLGGLGGAIIGALPGYYMLVRSGGRHGRVPAVLGALAGMYGGGLGVRALQKEKGERLRPDLIATETAIHNAFGPLYPFTPLMTALMFRKVYKDKSKK